MTLLSIIALATGLNMPAPSAPPVSSTVLAQTRLDSLVAAQEPALRKRSLESALKQDHTALEAAIKTPAVAERQTDLVEQARATLDRLVARNESRLRGRALDAAQMEGELAFSRGLAVEVHSSAIAEEVASEQNALAERVSTH